MYNFIGFASLIYFILFLSLLTILSKKKKKIVLQTQE